MDEHRDHWWWQGTKISDISNKTFDLEQYVYIEPYFGLIIQKPGIQDDSDIFQVSDSLLWCVCPDEATILLDSQNPSSMYFFYTVFSVEKKWQYLLSSASVGSDIHFNFSKKI